MTICNCAKCRRRATLTRNGVQAEVFNTTQETDEEHTDAQSIEVWPDDHTRYTIHDVYNHRACSLGTEDGLAASTKTIYTGYFNGTRTILSRYAIYPRLFTRKCIDAAAAKARRPRNGTYHRLHVLNNTPHAALHGCSQPISPVHWHHEHT